LFKTLFDIPRHQRYHQLMTSTKAALKDQPRYSKGDRFVSFGITTRIVEVEPTKHASGQWIYGMKGPRTKGAPWRVLESQLTMGMFGELR
jgi:hypothetical protein